MSPQIYTVRCNPASTEPFKTTLWKDGAEVTQDITVKVQTDFKLTAEQGFTLRIAPTTTTDIPRVDGQGTATLSFTDRCMQIVDITLNLAALGPGGPFPMRPRPIIRNRPARPPNPLKVLAYVTLALLAAIIVFIVIRNYLG